MPEPPVHERRPRRTFLVVAVVTVLMIATAAWWAADRSLGPDARAEPASGRTTGTAPSDRSFAWLARPQGRFTDGQVQELATGYTYVVMDRAHGGANIGVQLEDARRIKAVNPAVRVLVYVNAAFWYDTNSTPGGWNAPYDPAWSLADPAAGGPLRFTGTADRELATFVDLGNASYRAYLLRLLRTWLDTAPIDGVAFDSVQPASAGRVVIGHPELTWSDVLAGPRLDRYNDGLLALLHDAKALLGPGREVLFNGIADTSLARNRNLELVDDADGAVDESFCLDNALQHDPDKLRADLGLMSDLARQGKRLLEKTNTRGMVGPELQRFGRYCTGAFLLGWQPGSTFFKFGPAYTTDELRSNPAELQTQLGQPLGDYSEEAGTARRDCENGTVLVNLSDRPAVVRLRTAGTLVSGGAMTPAGPDDPITLAPQDAAVVVTRGPSR